MIGVERLFQLFTEKLALHEVALGADLEFVFEQLLQKLGGDVLVLQAAHFGPKFVAEDGDVGRLQAGRRKDVDHLALGRDGLAHELADGASRRSAEREKERPCTTHLW